MYLQGLCQSLQGGEFWDGKMCWVGLAGCGAVKRENKSETGDNLLSVPLTCLLLDLLHLPLHVSKERSTIASSVYSVSCRLVYEHGSTLSFSIILYASFYPLSGSAKVIVQPSNTSLCIQAPSQPASICVCVCLLCVYSLSFLASPNNSPTVINIV